MKYKFIEKHREIYSIGLQCKVLKVSRSGYYKWLKRIKQSQRTVEHELENLIEKIFIQNRKVYGYRRTKKALAKKGINCNHKRIQRIMKVKALFAKPKKRFKVTTTDSKGNKLNFPNLLNGKVAQRPGEILASDITFIRTSEGWLFLAVVMDLYTREILGYAIKDKMPAELIIEALTKTFKKINPRDVKFFHSDRGKQFSSYKVRNMLKYYGIKQSMSRKGNCYDNAIVESFFHSMKTEWLYRQGLKNINRIKLEVFDYIEIFYNTTRLHSSLNYMSPKEVKENFDKSKLVA